MKRHPISEWLRWPTYQSDYLLTWGYLYISFQIDTQKTCPTFSTCYICYWRIRKYKVRLRIIFCHRVANQGNTAIWNLERCVHFVSSGHECSCHPVFNSLSGENSSTNLLLSVSCCWSDIGRKKNSWTEPMLLLAGKRMRDLIRIEGDNGKSQNSNCPTLYIVSKIFLNNIKVVHSTSCMTSV